MIKPVHNLVHELILDRPDGVRDVEVLGDRNGRWTYTVLAQKIRAAGAGLQRLGLRRNDRLAVYLPKQLETVVFMFAANFAGGAFVPIHPNLKNRQVQHIVEDCEVRILVTAASRFQILKPALRRCPSLQAVILVDTGSEQIDASRFRVVNWLQDQPQGHSQALPRVIDTDMSAILYTSGSTGKSKGVVLSHRNILAGAASVAAYLKIQPSDRVLAALPFSFDYGLNQLTVSLLCGAPCIVMDYLLPRDLIRMMVQEKITVLAGVPSLWLQLAQATWPRSVNDHLRIMTNSGGKLPKAALNKLRSHAPNAKFFLMYGLTEAFRSTYLPPEYIDRKPDSIGIAVPNAEIMVVRQDGSPCSVNEPGELVHRGSLVAMGYWNNQTESAHRFRPYPQKVDGIPRQEIAVWSGDTVKMDEEGYLYFIGRQDEMIKTSGYRVSPGEIEEAIYDSGLVQEAAVFGFPHPILGQAIAVGIVPIQDQEEFDCNPLLAYCKKELPNFMVPMIIKPLQALPKNANGKVDRRALSTLIDNPFTDHADD